MKTRVEYVRFRVVRTGKEPANTPVHRYTYNRFILGSVLAYLLRF